MTERAPSIREMLQAAIDQQMVVREIVREGNGTIRLVLTSDDTSSALTDELGQMRAAREAKPARSSPYMGDMGHGREQ